jgi:hypothetical protein
MHVEIFFHGGLCSMRTEFLFTLYLGNGVNIEPPPPTTTTTGNFQSYGTPISAAVEI